MSRSVVRAENLDEATAHVRVKAARLIREGKVRLQTNWVAFVEGDTAEYRVRRYTESGAMVYDCSCDWGLGKFGSHILGVCLPCSHIAAASQLWAEQVVQRRDSTISQPRPARKPATLPPVPGTWRNAKGSEVYVMGFSVQNCDRAHDAWVSWAEYEDHEIEPELRRLGFRPVAELQTEAERAELEWLEDLLAS